MTVPENPEELVPLLARLIREYVYSPEALHQMINMVSVLGAHVRLLQDEVQELKDQVNELQDELQREHNERHVR